MSSNINENISYKYKEHLDSFQNQFMKVMPKQLWLYLFSFLNTPKDLINTSLACKSWLYISKDPIFLKIFMSKLFPSKHLLINTIKYKEKLKPTNEHLVNRSGDKDEKLIGKKIKTLPTEIQNTLINLDLPNKQSLNKKDITTVFSGIKKKLNLTNCKAKNIKISEKIIFIPIFYKRRIQSGLNLPVNIKNNLLLLVDKKKRSLIGVIYKKTKAIEEFISTKEGKIYVTYATKNNEKCFYTYDILQQKSKCNIF